MALQHRYSPNLLEAGCDEAGRGCLAGPVTCAAVILPEDFNFEGVNDSKQLTEAKREKLRPIIEREALAWAVVHIPVETIDSINILKSSILGMQQAALQLKVKPELLLIDGNRFYPLEGYQHQTIVKGDAKFLSIAAASILAKTHRDEFMQRIDNEYGVYNWRKNKGYPTKDHRAAIAKFGSCEWHRKSFNLLGNQLKLELE